ncbi:MAG: serine/threonine protein kinase [Myxococcales bacterium]|nr:serine/threonine protein kinase [Myxococcales bacterium]
MEPDLDALLAELAAAPPVSVTDLAARRPWQAGDVVLGLTLVSPLGEGGMGRVWRARDASLGRDVAVKELRGVDDPRRVAAFHQEALALGRLAHPHIVQIHRTGAHQGRPVLVMECLVGETLADRLGRGPLPAPEGLRILRAVLAALDHAHRAGVLHRDLKPANVHLDAAGHVRVLDFGLAHLQGEGPLAAAGTPGFMAPEQRAGGAQDARTDVWAAGALGQAILGEAAPTRARLAAAGDPPTGPRLALRLRVARRRPSSSAWRPRRWSRPPPCSPCGRPTSRGDGAGRTPWSSSCAARPPAAPRSSSAPGTTPGRWRDPCGPRASTWSASSRVGPAGHAPSAASTCA